MNYIWHAFKHPLNLLFMGTGMVAGLFFLNPLFYPVLFAVEGFFLFAAATNKRFQTVVKSRLIGEEDEMLIRRQKTVLMGTRSPMKSRLYKTEELIRKIKLNTRQNKPGSVEASEKMLHGLADLEKNFVRLLHSYCRLDDLEIQAKQGGDLSSETDKAKADLATASDESAKEIYARKLEVLEKRKSNAEIAGKTKAQLLSQLDLVDETFKLLHDQSVSVYDPQTLLKQIDDVTLRMDTTRQTLLEIEKFSGVSDAAFDLARLQNRQ